MRIKNEIFLSRELGNLKLDAGDGVQCLKTDLEKSAKNANEITIVSAYFSKSFVLELLRVPAKKNECRLRLIFGYDGIGDLAYNEKRVDEIREELRKMGYRKKNIFARIIRIKVPLHTKLFGFLRNTSRTWYVGSANASEAISGDRHELMVKLYGKSELLGRYVSEFLSWPEPEATSDNLDEVGFWATGYLIYKPSRELRFTFDAFRIPSESRRRLSRFLGQSTGVEFSDPTVEGFGFNLLDALGIAAATDSSVATNRLRFRHLCVETEIGYWMPQRYLVELDGRLGESERQEKDQLRKIGARLNSIGSKNFEIELGGKFEKYLHESKQMFASQNIVYSEGPDLKKRFEEFVFSRKERLNNEAWIDRMCKKLMYGKMPNIGGDIAAVEAFSNSFYQGITDAMMMSSTRTRICTDLMDELGLDDEDLRDVKKLRGKICEKLSDGWSFR